MISSTNVDSGELLGLVMNEFGLESVDNNKAKSLDAIFTYLIKEYSRGKRVLLVVDEAQNLSVQALEEIRMISNLQTDDQMLLQIILVGQPELKRRLQSVELTQLTQRISVFYHLGALERNELEEYIAFRLEKADGARDIFEDDTFDLMYKASGGIPRIINILCDTALVYGYAESMKHISVEILSEVIKDKEGLGLMVDESTARETFQTPEMKGDENHSARLLALEEKFTSLQQQVHWRLAEIDRQGTQANERLITELTELLRAEREKADKILLEYASLKTKISILQNRNTKNDSSAVTKSPVKVDTTIPLSPTKQYGQNANQQKTSKEKPGNLFQRIVQFLS
jgi:hypothetical protein